MTVALRLASRGDAEAIARSYNQGIAERIGAFETRPRSRGDIERTLADRAGRYPMVVLERDGAVVG